MAETRPLGRVQRREAAPSHFFNYLRRDVYPSGGVKVCSPAPSLTVGFLPFTYPPS